MSVGKLLYVPPRGIGDLVFSLPLLHSIHSAWPFLDIEIPIPNRESLRQMIDLISFVKPCDVYLPKPSEDFLAEKRWRASQLGDSKRKYKIEKEIFEKYLAGFSYDLAIVAKPFEIESVEAPQVTRKNLDQMGFDWRKAHMVDGFSAFATYMGIPVSESFDLMFDLNQSIVLNNNVLRFNSSYVVFNLGASGNIRKWSAEGYKEVASWLNKQGFISILVGTPTEYNLSQEIEEGGKGIINLVSSKEYLLNLKNYVVLTSGAKVVVGGDSGLLHLADAIGVPVVGFYGPTNPEKFGPYHNMENVISRYNEDKSLLGISTLDVINKLEKVLKDG